MRIIQLSKLTIIALLCLSTPALASEVAEPSQGWGFVVNFINFAVFLCLLVYFARKPIAKALRGRQEKIRHELEALEASREEAARAKASAQELLSAAAAESKRLIEEYRKQAEAERLRILDQASEQIKHMHEQARLTIERELAIAQDRLKKELALAAVTAAEGMIRQQMTPQDQDRLNQEFLANLGRDKAGAK